MCTLFTKTEHLTSSLVPPFLYNDTVKFIATCKTFKGILVFLKKEQLINTSLPLISNFSTSIKHDCPLLNHDQHLKCLAAIYNQLV